MIDQIARFFAVIMMLMAMNAMAEQPKKEELAVIAAKNRLVMVDQEKYAESWKEAAGYFKSAVKQEQWEQMLPTVRKPLGKLVSRAVKSATYKTALPGAPDGEYVIIEFESAFEHKKSAIETVTPMMDKDGKWRVSGYFIK